MAVAARAALGAPLLLARDTLPLASLEYLLLPPAAGMCTAYCSTASYVTGVPATAPHERQARLAETYEQIRYERAEQLSLRAQLEMRPEPTARRTSRSDEVSRRCEVTVSHHASSQRDVGLRDDAWRLTVQ